MSSTLRQAAQQALEAMEYSGMDVGKFNRINAACRALRAALVEDAMQKFTDVNQEIEAALAEPDLFHCPKCGGPADNGHDRSIPPSPYWCTKCMAEPVQEPVAWIDNSGHPKHIRHLQSVTERRLYGPLRPLFAAPPQRTLTDEVIADLWHQNGGFHHHFARAVERYLKGEK